MNLVVEHIAQFGKVARRRDLIENGCTDWGIAVAQRDGLITKVAPGYFALPGAHPLDVRLAQHQARRACFSQAEELGLWVVKPPDQPHVATAHGRPVPGCVVHKISGVPTLFDILRQCVQCGTEVEALAVLESAVVLKRCTIPELRAAFAGRQRANGRAIIDMIDPQSMSIVETLARYYLRQAGYNVQSQFHVRNMGHVDLLIEGLLGLETDGAAYHNNPTAWEEDLVRNNLMMIEGLPCLRVSARLVLTNPEIMLRWVRQALETLTDK
ncbi:very-short-patch-repair endonuclease [Arthrobacter stackebrandtii]|uniref:Very-short-patch-repair endonuclease n=1 Tax=Arthrobacter stackebrandtii TaxID=272161 RepID=A0ABS4YSP8_9MICC|nr:hypothetical protein [Arthrobacter stackebrandtii]MBP2411818.1 very-short-patch-repair endonuclease [Arthrobacter stackebrandtii]